jgi:hypothetical protein
VLSTPMSSVWSLPFWFSDHNLVLISRHSHTCYMSYVSHPYLLHHPNNIKWLYKLRSFSLCSLLQLPLKSKYSLHHSVLKHPLSSVLSLVWETKVHTHTKQQVNLFCIF